MQKALSTCGYNNSQISYRNIPVADEIDYKLNKFSDKAYYVGWSRDKIWNIDYKGDTIYYAPIEYNERYWILYNIMNDCAIIAYKKLFLCNKDLTET